MHENLSWTGGSCSNLGAGAESSNLGIGALLH